MVYNGRDVIIKFNMMLDISLVILDLMMLEMNGMDVICQVCKDFLILILVLFVKMVDMDKIQGLVIGVDDYVIKFFNLLEVMVWVKFLLWCSENQVINDKFDVLNVGLLVINKDFYEVKILKGD